MKVQLANVPTVVITTPWQRQRRSRLSRALRGLGFRHVQWVVGERSTPYWSGHAVEVRQLLASHVCPLLVLEDDGTMLTEN